MTADIGFLGLLIALAISAVQGIIPFCQINSRRFNHNNFISYTVTVAVIACSIAFACLIYAFVTSDFSVALVVTNSHILKPLIYKISGAWGNHEGSMLLFIWLLSMLTLLYQLRSKEVFSFKYKVLAVQGLLQAGLLLYLIITSNPFEKIFPPAVAGQGLNPLLQDIGLALHPPMLYLGYIGFSLAFSYAVISLLTGRVDKKWAVELKKWVVASVGILTLGIALGSWWAYRELGWGGFWFWDPVENSSLLPWLSGIALLHSILVLEKRGTLKKWSVLLSILTFSLCLTGFFLVRSGILTSVHSFASDPYRGIFILALVTVFSGGAFCLFAARAHKVAAQDFKFKALSKEAFLLVNNLLLVTLCATVLLGTLYPILLEVITGTHVSVGTPYFNKTFNPIAIIALIFAGLAPAIKWGDDKSANMLKSAKPAFLAALITGIILSMRVGELSISVIALMFSMFLFVATIKMLMDRAKPLSIRKISALPGSFLSMIMAHLGIAVLAAAITIASHWAEEKETMLQNGDVTNIAGYKIIYEGVELVKGKNYLAKSGTFTVEKTGKEIAVLKPEKRAYMAEGTQTTEAAIHSAIDGDLYIVIGDSTPEDKISARFYFKPFIGWIWAGAVMIFIGCLLPLLKRKGRTG